MWASLWYLPKGVCETALPPSLVLDSLAPELQVEEGDSVDAVVPPALLVSGTEPGLEIEETLPGLQVLDSVPSLEISD